MSKEGTNAWLGGYAKVFSQDGKELLSKYGNREHSGHIFQRMVITENIYLEDYEVHKISTENLNRVLSLKDSDGWRYFEDFKPLPPDSDDLAQILKVACLWGSTDQISMVIEELQILSKNIRDNGSINTWLLSDPAESDFTSKFWGRGYGGTEDSEVVANVVTALSMLSKLNQMALIVFKERLNDILEFLISKQEPEGFWKSTWYFGPYYGTYHCLRAINGGHQLKRVNDKSIRFLSSIGAKGDYGDSLSTALAISSGSILGMSLEKSVSVLLDQQSREGSWPAAQWIDTHQNDGIIVGGQTITTSYCIKALTDYLGLKR